MKLKKPYFTSSGVPLGGIGCGTVEIRGDGRLYEWHIFNNGRWALREVDRNLEFMDPEDFYFVIRVKDDNKVVVRFLQAFKGYRQLEKRTDLCAGCSGDPYTMPWLRSVDEIEFNGEPPFAFLRYMDKDLPVEVTLEAFTPFIPGDTKNSSLPVSLFLFKVRNVSGRRIELSLLCGLKSPFSTIPARTVAETASLDKGNVKGITVNLSGLDIPEDHPMYGGCISLGIFGLNLETGYKLGIPLDEAVFRKVWVEYRVTGLLRDQRRKDVFKDYVHFALVGKRSLGEYEEAEIVVLLTWYFPGFYDVLGNRLGHFYENMFSSSSEVLRYVIENFDYLYKYTKRFHDILYSTTIDAWLIDLVASQLTTLQKSTIYTKSGLFGVWEGYGCCGLNTTDVAFYGSIMILQLFPDLERKWIEYHAKWKLDEQFWPYYETLALSIPENASLFKEMVKRDPLIVTNMDRFKEAVRRVVKATGKDPRGRVMHFFVGSFELPDAYDRVDMNPEYVLLCIRDAVWLGDKELLAEVWNTLKEAMDSILRIHDPLNEALIYHYTPAGYEALSQSIVKHVPRVESMQPYRRFLLSLATGYTFTPISAQTFDAWSFIGYASFTNILWLAAIKAMIYASRVLGDNEYRERLEELYQRARENILRYLWNGEYFDLWYDPVSNKRDHGCASSQIDGQMFISLMLNLGYLVEREKILSVLKAIYKYNFKDEEGLINGSYPDLPRPATAGELLLSSTGLTYTVGSQIDTPWTGIEFEVAAHMIHEGLINEALNVLRSIHERYSRYGEYWNHIECGSHYYRAMDSWLVLMAIEGLFYNGLEARLVFMPRLNGESFKGLFLVTGTWGTVEHTVKNKTQRLSISLEKGSLHLESIELEAFGDIVKHVRVEVDGVELQATWTKTNEKTLRLKLHNKVEVSRSITVDITYA